jgi:hypothetical protein
VYHPLAQIPMGIDMHMAGVKRSVSMLVHMMHIHGVVCMCSVPPEVEGDVVVEGVVVPLSGNKGAL